MTKSPFLRQTTRDWQSQNHVFEQMAICAYRSLQPDGWW